jgi:hypothetical protein
MAAPKARLARDRLDARARAFPQVVPPAGIEPATHGLGNGLQHSFLGTPSSKIGGRATQSLGDTVRHPTMGPGPAGGGSGRLLCAPLLEGPDQS